MKIESNEKPREDSGIIRLALERFRLVADAEAEMRRESLDDLNFRIGNQWPSEIQAQRNLEKRPCLTMNRMPQFIRQVTNEQRSQRPSIEVSPIGGGADKQTAEVYQGIIRHIEVNSDASVAYDNAFDSMVTGGFGFWRVITDYADDGSFEQEIFIRRVKNPFSIYVDPAAAEPDYSDARFAFVVSDIPFDDFKGQYPNSVLRNASDLMSIGDQAPGWINSSANMVRIAEYFAVEDNEITVHRLADGRTVEDDELPEGVVPVASRKRTKRTVRWYKINGVEILEETIWPGRYMPIVPVVGDDLDVNGCRYIAGLVRNAKDPQRMYNYWISAATEMIALAPKSPFIVEEGQIEGHQEMWRQANTSNQAYLVYKGVSVAGQAAPPPQRNNAEPPIMAISRMIAQADNDLKATTGIYDASLGEQGPQESGRAILARQKQSDIATLNYSDNMARALRYTGKILIDLIPKIYDTPRIQRIIMPDQTEQHVGVFNSALSQVSSQVAQMQLEGIQRIHDLGVGRYDVAVSIGPSYQSKRQESAASMMALVQAYPQVFSIIGDLLVRDMDWPGADQIAERLKKTLPPALQQDDSADPKQQLAATTAKLQELMQQNQALTAALNQASETIQKRLIEQQTKLMTVGMNNETSLAVAQIQTRAQDGIARAQQAHDAWTDMHDAAHEQAMQAGAPAPAPSPAQPAQQAQ